MQHGTPLRPAVHVLEPPSNLPFHSAQSARRHDGRDTYDYSRSLRTAADNAQQQQLVRRPQEFRQPHPPLTGPDKMHVGDSISGDLHCARVTVKLAVCTSGLLATSAASRYRRSKPVHCVCDSMRTVKEAKLAIMATIESLNAINVRHRLMASDFHLENGDRWLDERLTLGQYACGSEEVRRTSLLSCIVAKSSLSCPLTTNLTPIGI